MTRMILMKTYMRPKSSKQSSPSHRITAAKMDNKTEDRVALPEQIIVKTWAIIPSTRDNRTQSFLISECLQVKNRAGQKIRSDPHSRLTWTRARKANQGTAHTSNSRDRAKRTTTHRRSEQLDKVVLSDPVSTSQCYPLSQEQEIISILSLLARIRGRAKESMASEWQVAEQALDRKQICREHVSFIQDNVKINS